MEYTIGAGFNVGVYAAEGKKDNCNEDCSEIVTTKEYGAFQADYGSVFVEVGNGALDQSIRNILAWCKILKCSPQFGEFENFDETFTNFDGACRIFYQVK